MMSIRVVAALLISLALASPVHAGQAQGQLTLAGKTVPMKVANAMALTDYEGKPFTLVLLTEAPVDLSSVLASPDPFMELINFPPIDAVTHAMVLITDDRVSINAHSAGDNTQYLASRKLGLEARVSGGGAQPIEGSLRSTDAGMSVQIEVTFKADIIKAGS